MNDIQISKIALLDKMIYYNVELVNISDVDTLLEKGLLTQKVTRGELKNNICIKEKGYIFKCGYTGLGDYGTLETNIVNEDYGNLMCYTVDRYKSRIEEIKEDLKRSYGIEINTDFLKVNKLEVNKTLPIDGTMGEYKRVFELLMAIIPANARLNVKTTISNT